VHKSSHTRTYTYTHILTGVQGEPAPPQHHLLILCLLLIFTLICRLPLSFLLLRAPRQKLHTHTHTNTRTYKHTHTHTRTQTYKLTYLIHLKCAAAGTYCTGVATHYLMLLPLTTTALFNFFAVVEKRVFFFTIVRQLHRADPTELLCLFVYVCA